MVDRVSDGAGRVYEIGKVYDDLPEDRAASWIARGLAVAAVEAAPVVVAPEAAALKGPEETAVLPRAAKR